MKKCRSLAEVLQSTSDVLFPDEMGERVVAVDSRDVCGDTPLHVMTWRSDRHAVKLLIEAGADIDAIGDMSETPLHIATRKGDEEIWKCYWQLVPRQIFDPSSTRQQRKLRRRLETKCENCSGAMQPNKLLHATAQSAARGKCR